MSGEFLIRDIFRLSNGTTVFACEGDLSAQDLAGRRAAIVVAGQIRQEITFCGERVMTRPSRHQNQRILETRDSVNLTLEEAQSGQGRVVLA